jgi:HrpA-like RNA helicase
LVFLPGLYEITKLQNMIRASLREYEMDPNEVLVVPLHGALSTSNQTKVFQRLVTYFVS